MSQTSLRWGAAPDSALARRQETRPPLTISTASGFGSLSPLPTSGVNLKYLRAGGCDEPHDGGAW